MLKLVSQLKCFKESSQYVAKSDSLQDTSLAGFLFSYFAIACNFSSQPNALDN